MNALLASGALTTIDWAVVGGYLLLTTLLCVVLSDKQQTFRDFFLGGRTLPWYAVAGSIISTEISAVTFVGVPAISYAIKGNFTYLQLGIGTILARIIVGFWFVPRYYEREIYSPYDYMEQRLGPRVKKLVTVLFLIGQLLGQGVRVGLTAVVLQVATGNRLNLHESIWLIGVISIAWTLIGGISSVVWTDVMLFLMFTAGAVVALVYIVGGVEGGFPQVLEIARQATDATGKPVDKFQFFDFSLDPTLQFTFWVGITLSVWGSLYSYGTDQMMAQRLFCCRGVTPARWAIISSGVSQLVPATCLVIGIALYAYFKQHPLAGADAAFLKEDGDRIFPYFIVNKLPNGVRGMIIAAIFAAAIPASSLAAMTQTFMSAFWQPWRRRRAGLGPGDPDSPDAERRDMFLSRILIVVSGAALSGMAYVGFAAKRDIPEVLNLALSMVGYTGGGLLAAFALAFLRIKVDDRGIIWSVPLSMLAVFGLAWKPWWSTLVALVGAGILLAAWFAKGDRRLGKTILFAVGLWVALVIHFYVGVPRHGFVYLKPFAWPYWIPIGSLVAFVWGYLLADRRVQKPRAPDGVSV